MCTESAPIDPASDEHVLGGKLLESQRAAVGEAPALRPYHKAFDKAREGERGPEIGGRQRERDEMGWEDGEEMGKWALSSV